MAITMIWLFLIAVTTLLPSAASDGGTCTEISGNWYCSATTAITYSNFGSSGNYQEITEMSSSGSCSSKSKSYSGPMSPLNDEVSFHFRGPLALKQFAVYTPKAVEKRTAEASKHAARHFHDRFHAAKKPKKTQTTRTELKPRDADENWVTATINGQAVSWVNDYVPGAPLPTATVTIDNNLWVTATINGHVVSWMNQYNPGATSQAPSSAINQMGTVIAKTSSSPLKSSSIPTQSSSITPSSALTPTPVGANQMGTVVEIPKSVSKVTASGPQWVRQASYKADSQTAEGLMFLNNYGGQHSGVFDYNFGASLSYASSDGKTGAASPQILADTLIEDNVEVIVFSDKKCNGDCGYVRPGTVAYHGFDGASKVFLIEFSMPVTGKRGWGEDMPAIWLLNAQIPRTLQYGKAECSCWATGCGEWDLFETLNSGNLFAKSTVHADASGGDSDYFERPCDKTIKAAVVFDGAHNAGHIRVLNDDFVFGEALSAADFAGFCSLQGATEFKMGG